MKLGIVRINDGDNKIYDLLNIESEYDIVIDN
jgi:hypothetical protein